MKTFIILILSSAIVININGQIIPAADRETVESHLLEQLSVYPQEKIHLHLDRDMYVPGEKIWFKAYLVDAFSHQYPTKSRYVYVELVSTADTLISRVMIRPDNGVHDGHIFLSEKIPEGHYTIRAYTKYMENQGDDYFFMKDIYIGNLQSDVTEPEKKSKKKEKTPDAKTDFDISFFPEGGNLLDRAMCRVAFKALNEDGSAEHITGELTDEHGEIIIPVKTFHEGMGMFAFIPCVDKKYYLHCTNSKGMEKVFELPDPIPGAHTLQTYQREDKLIIVSKRSIDIQSNDPLYILIHCRGSLLYFDQWDYEKKCITINHKELPSGVIQIVLFDEQMNPLSERLVFNMNEDQAKLEFQTNKQGYTKRDHVISELKVTDEEGTPLIGNLSVSITDDKDIEINNSESILTSLLLSSELKGHIKLPGIYLENKDDRTLAALDYVMMTHGWRRYNIPEVVKGKIGQPEKLPETSQLISGTVQRMITSKPVEGSNVTMITSDGEIGFAQSDNRGKFAFINFEFPDSTTYFIQSLSKKGSHNVRLFMDEINPPSPKHIHFTQPTPARSTPTVENALENGFLNKAEQRAKYDENMRIIHLSNVNITAPKIDKEEKKLPWYASGADATIDRKKIETRNPIQVTDMLYQVAGVNITSEGYVTIRGGGSINNSPFPLVLIDGVPMEWPTNMKNRMQSPLEVVPVNTVDRIDVYKGASAAMFGMRGGNGVISITTRRGGDVNDEKEMFNRIVLSPLGYQKPAEFYSPKYETSESKHLGNPDYRTTIFWKPDIITNEDGEASFDFYTSDFSTTYSVVIEGVTTNGKIVRKVQKLQVY